MRVIDNHTHYASQYSPSSLPKRGTKRPHGMHTVGNPLPSSSFLVSHRYSSFLAEIMQCTRVPLWDVIMVGITFSSADATVVRALLRLPGPWMLSQRWSAGRYR